MLPEVKEKYNLDNIGCSGQPQLRRTFFLGSFCLEFDWEVFINGLIINR